MGEGGLPTQTWWPLWWCRTRSQTVLETAYWIWIMELERRCMKNKWGSGSLCHNPPFTNALNLVHAPEDSGTGMCSSDFLNWILMTACCSSSLLFLMGLPTDFIAFPRAGKIQSTQHYGLYKRKQPNIHFGIFNIIYFFLSCHRSSLKNRKSALFLLLVPLFFLQSFC